VTSPLGNSWSEESLRAPQIHQCDPQYVRERSASRTFEGSALSSNSSPRCLSLRKAALIFRVSESTTGVVEAVCLGSTNSCISSETMACASHRRGSLHAAAVQDTISNAVDPGVRGRFGRRPDIAALGIVLVFVAFANAAGMVGPVAEAQEWLMEWTGIRSVVLATTVLRACRV